MADRMLIRNGIVLTQDPSLGELPSADVLVEGDTIAAVGPNLSAEGAEVIDAEGDIVIPGFVDSHRHTWETSIRTCAPDYTLGAYFAGILDKFAPHYRPDDVYAANLLGRARVRERGHHDARRLVAHHEHARARRRGDPGPPGVRHPVGLRVRLPEHVAPGLVVRPRLRRQRPRDRRRPRPPPPERVLQLRRQPDHDGPRDARHELLPRGGRPQRVGAREGARPQHHGPRRDVPLRLHEDAADASSRRWTSSTRTRPTSTRRTCCDDEWAMVRDSGSNVSYAPQIELQMGHGWAQAVTARDYGVPIGLSSDVATTASSDQFTQMHAIFASERARRYEIAWDENLEWDQPESKLITSRDVLAMATIGGAQGRRHRRPDGIDHAGQEGRPRDHRRPRGQRRAGHRPGRGGRLRGRHLERRHGHRRRHDPQARRQARSPISSGPRQRVKASRDYLSASSTSPSRAGCRRQSPPSHVITAGRPGGRPAGSARPSAARVGVAPNAGPARRPRRALRQMPRSRRVSSRGRATRRRWAAGRSTGVPSAASSLRHGPAPAPPTASRPPAAGSRTSSRRRARTRP